MASNVSLWIAEYSCKCLCKAFVHQDSYEDPERVLDAHFQIITETLKLSQHPEKRGIQWLLLAELCFRFHRFGMEMEDSSNSMVFSDIIVQLFKEHGITEEKTSQLKADLTKIQDIKSKNLKSRTLTRKVDKAYKKLLNEVQMITEQIISSLGPTFLDMIDDIVNSIGPTNQLGLFDILDLMDQYVKETNELRKDDELEGDLDMNRKRSQKTGGTKKLYNPSRHFPYQSGSSTERSGSACAVLLDRPSSSGIRSSPRLSAKKIVCQSTSTSEAFHNQEDDGASRKFPHENRLQSSVAESASKNEKLSGVSSNAQSSHCAMDDGSDIGEMDGSIEGVDECPRHGNSSERSSTKMVSDSDISLQGEAVEVSSQSDVDISRNRSSRRKRTRLEFSEASPVISQKDGKYREEEVLESEHESLEVSGSSIAEECESSVEIDGPTPAQCSKVVSTRRLADNSSSSNDSILEEANLPSSKPRKRRKFSQEEEEWLREGVRRFGVGKWRCILDAYRFNGRTTVNLKDKWRNLVKAGLT